MCLMYHLEFSETAKALTAESARVASLSFADPVEQQQALSRLQLQIKAALDRFYALY